MSDNAQPSTVTEAEAADLRAQLVALRAEVAQLRESLGALPGGPPAIQAVTGPNRTATAPASATPPPGPGPNGGGPAPVGSDTRAPKSGSWTRRALLLGGTGAAAGAVASVAGAGSAAAAAGTMYYGDTNYAGADGTALGSESGYTTLALTNYGNGAALTARSGSSPAVSGESGSNAGVEGISSSDAGVRGTSDQGYGLVAWSNAGAPVHLSSGSHTGPPTWGTWEQGALHAATDGALSWCVQSGSPGVWRLVSSRESSVFIPLTPTRVYDSRVPLPSPGPLVPGVPRDISVANGRNLTTGAVTISNLVPLGARAVALNLTVAAGTGAGSVALAPGGAASYGASAINFEANQRLANGLICSINPATRQIRAFGITSSVAVIVDVMGYFR